MYQNKLKLNPDPTNSSSSEISVISSLVFQPRSSAKNISPAPTARNFGSYSTHISTSFPTSILKSKICKFLCIQKHLDHDTAISVSNAIVELTTATLYSGVPEIYIKKLQRVKTDITCIVTLVPRVYQYCLTLALAPGRLESVESPGRIEVSGFPFNFLKYFFVFLLENIM